MVATAAWLANGVALGAGQPAAQVSANGNVITEAIMPGSLNFNPKAVSVSVGDTVRWTNTDLLVPHTVTEDHGLFNLTGTYGGTPANPPGFGPGTSVERQFTAGTFHYFCEVHPVQMHGTVAVPAALRVRHGAHHGFRVVATWATAALPQGQVSDVQRRGRGHGWTTVRRGTTVLHASFPGGMKGSRWSFRVRVRRDGDTAASGYSPTARIRV